MCKIIFLYGKDFLVMPVFNLAIALFLPYLTKSRCSQGLSPLAPLG
ncbi:hypothetical protein [Anabaena lutea]|nr:hypothetical protein [Anabaena lutea]